MRIYLSGPITGVENYHLNFLKAENQVRDIFKNDEVINPMWMGNMLPGGSRKVRAWRKVLLKKWA